LYQGNIKIDKMTEVQLHVWQRKNNDTYMD